MRPAWTRSASVWRQWLSEPTRILYSSVWLSRLQSEELKCTLKHLSILVIRYCIKMPNKKMLIHLLPIPMHKVFITENLMTIWLIMLIRSYSFLNYVHLIPCHKERRLGDAYQLKLPDVKRYNDFKINANPGLFSQWRWLVTWAKYDHRQSNVERSVRINDIVYANLQCEAGPKSSRINMWVQVLRVWGILRSVNSDICQ